MVLTLLIVHPGGVNPFFLLFSAYIIDCILPLEPTKTACIESFGSSGRRLSPYLHFDTI